MKQFITLLFASIVLLIANTQINACGLDPTAVIDVYPGNDVVFYDGDYIYLEAYASTANCGYITVIEWQIDGVVVSNGWGFEPDFSLDQYEYNRRFDVQLTVGNSGGNTDTVTKTIAIVSEFKSYYYLKDHLGSVRVTVNDAGVAVGWDDYYPFGLQMPGRTQNASNPNEDIKFTGYELEQQCETDSSGGCINDVVLGLYHAGARMYDPVIGRFNSIDPLASEFPSMTPFHYSNNNPTGFNDPTGMCPERFGEDVCDFLNQFDVFRAFFAQPEDDSDEAVEEVAEQKEHAGMIASAMEEGGELIQRMIDRYSWIPGLDAAFKGAEGDVGGAALDLALSTLPVKFNPKSINHIFRKASGHLMDTPSNRKLLIDTANSSENFVGTDKFGNKWFARELPNGKQVWTSVRGNEIRNGGLNNTPRKFNSETGLNNPGN